MTLFRRMILMLIIYNFIFPLRLSYAPYSAELILGSSLLYVFATVSRGGSRLITRREVLLVVAAWACLFCVSAMSVLINGTYDFGMSVVLLNYLFTLVYSLLLAAAIAKGAFGRSWDSRAILEAVVISCLIVAASVYLDVFSPTAKQFFITNIYKTGNIDYAESFRASGLSASGGASLSFGLALGSGMALLLAITARDSRKRLIFFPSALFLLCATLFVGRSGVVFAVVFVLASLRHLSTGRLTSLLVAALVIGVAAWLVLPMLSDDAANYFSHHILEVFDNYKERGTIETSTTNAVEDMYFVPKFEHLIYGAGFLNEPAGGYILPDPGYMKVFLAFGLFGAALFYALSARIVWRTYGFLTRAANGAGFLVMAMMLSYFVYEFKEPAFYQNYQFRILMLCFAMAVVERARLKMTESRGAAFSKDGAEIPISGAPAR